jgi:anti-sigma28 factor (negative regulator of flagellin synthesis)
MLSKVINAVVILLGIAGDRRAVQTFLCAYPAACWIEMKITSDTLDGALAPQTSRAQETARNHDGADRTTEAPRGGGDSVQISGLSSRMMDVASTDEARMANRVATLSAIYARGEYRTDSAKLSRAIVSHALGAVDGGE